MAADTHDLIQISPKPSAGSVRLTDLEASSDGLAPQRDVTVLLSKALKLAGDAGRPVAASRIAGQAWWALKETDPRGAARINGVMHYLARLPEEAGETFHETEFPMADPELDVRNEIPMRRHDLILGTYGELESGSGFILVNDHDPKPLYYQFAAEYPDKFTWDYLEEGPEVWKVRIGKPA